MSWYLNNPSLVPNDDASPQQLGDPSVTRSHMWSLGVPMSDADGLWSEAGGLQPQHVPPYQTLNFPDLAIAGNTPIEDIHTGNVQSLPQVSNQHGPPGSDILDNLEEYHAVQSHGRFELFVPFACYQCFAAFWNNSELLKHGKDTGHRPYACYCGKTFSRLYTLTRHLGSRSTTSVTGSVGAKHPCPLCTKYDGDKGFNRRDHLLQHLRVLHKIEDNGIAFVNDRTGRMGRAPAESVTQIIPMPHIG